MRYEDIVEMKKAWDAICGMVKEVANDKSKQLVMTTSVKGTDKYWLWSHDMQQEKDNHIIVTWCQHDGIPRHKDKVFENITEFKKWLFDEYTEAYIYDIYVDCI